MAFQPGRIGKEWSRKMWFFWPQQSLDEHMFKSKMSLFNFEHKSSYIRKAVGPSRRIGLFLHNRVVSKITRVNVYQNYMQYRWIHPSKASSTSSNWVYKRHINFMWRVWLHYYAHIHTTNKNTIEYRCYANQQGV